MDSLLFSLLCMAGAVGLFVVLIVAIAPRLPDWKN